MKIIRTFLACSSPKMSPMSVVIFEETQIGSTMDGTDPGDSNKTGWRFPARPRTERKAKICPENVSVTRSSRNDIVPCCRLVLIFNANIMFQ